MTGRSKKAKSEVAATEEEKTEETAVSLIGQEFVLTEKRQYICLQTGIELNKPNLEALAAEHGHSITWIDIICFPGHRPELPLIGVIVAALQQGVSTEAAMATVKGRKRSCRDICYYSRTPARAKEKPQLRVQGQPLYFREPKCPWE